MQRNFEFLEYTPSQQASAALILSINLSHSPIAEEIGLKRLGEKFTSEYGDDHHIPIDDSLDEINSIFDLKQDDTEEEPLAIWSTRMNELTKLSTRFDIKSVYS